MSGLRGIPVAGGLWLADLAANFLCIVVILLAVAARHAPAPGPASGPAMADTAETLPVLTLRPRPPAEMVELLRLRLDPSAMPEALRIDLTAAGALPAGDGQAGDGQAGDGQAGDGQAGGGRAGPDAPALVYVLAPGHHAALTAALIAAGAVWAEIDVPEALRDPPAAGEPASDRWAPAFLALAPLAGDPDRFRTALARLLAGTAAAAPPGPVGDEPGSGLGARFARLLALGNLLLTVVGLAVTLLVWRFGRPDRARRRQVQLRVPASSR